MLLFNQEIPCTHFINRHAQVDNLINNPMFRFIQNWRDIFQETSNPSDPRDEWKETFINEANQLLLKIKTRESIPAPIQTETSL